MRTMIEVPVGLFLEVMGMLPLPGNRHALPLEQQSTLRKLEKYEELARLPQLHIYGTRHSQRSTGNPYHKVRVFANEDQIAELGPSYGSGDQYLVTAMRWLEVNRPDLIPGWERSANVTIYLREEIAGTWGVTDVTRERDL